MPEISVLMPVYKTHSAHLKAAIKSILSQEDADFEFVILNDSPEQPELKEIISAYADPRIRYYENAATIGVAQSYNRLLELSRCEFAAMMNHDDIAFPARLKLQRDYLKAHPEVGLVGTAYKKFGEINRFKTVRNPERDAEIRAALLFKSAIHHPTIMFRRSLVEMHKIRYNENFISLNDRQLYYEIGRYAKLANLNQVLYKYRFHKDMVSKRLKSEIFKEQSMFHEMWFAHNGISLTPEEKYIFDHYAAMGRCRIKDAAILLSVSKILERLSTENRRKHFAVEPEFSALCAGYLVKRCLNAAICGRIPSSGILNDTELPVQKSSFLNLCNTVLNWIA